jgi:tricorn protease
MAKEQGYYRYPALFKDQLVFVSEGDLWTAPLGTLQARRLTFNRGEVRNPVFSPDGQWIAFSSSDEGHSEIYKVPAQGGPLQRLTYLGDMSYVLAWTEKGIYFSSCAGQPFSRVNSLFLLPHNHGVPQPIPLGPINFVHFEAPSEKGSVVIQRHGYREYGYWKRYRGGTAGTLWISKDADTYTPLVSLKGDLVRPLIVKGRVYFGSDHEGIGNLYSCLKDGSDLRRETAHQDYYVRNQSTDGHRIVYHAGGDVFLFDPEIGEKQKLNILYQSDRPGRSRKVFSAQKHLESYRLHPKGTHIAMTTRGKACFFSNWEGPVMTIGDKGSIRYRLPTWLSDGKRFVVVTDEEGMDSLAIYDATTSQCLSKAKKDLPIGRVTCLWPNPTDDFLMVTNHAHELILVDLKKWTVTLLDRSVAGAINGGDWSKDGAWFAYGTSIARNRYAIKLYNRKDKKTHQVTQPVLRDFSPSFDPEGKYLYFLSTRYFAPVWDSVHFDLGFQFATKPCALILQKDQRSPFYKLPDSLEGPCDKEKDEEESDKKSKKEKPLKIDLEGIQDRIVECPMESGDYTRLTAARGKILFLNHAISVMGDGGAPSDDTGTSLDYFDLDSQKTDIIASNVDGYHLSDDRDMVIYRLNRRLRVFKLGDKPDEDRSCNKKSGWIDLERIRLFVNPLDEWMQMYKEAWRLQRDHYWDPKLADVDWEAVYTLYLPLLDRVSTREEFSDVLWEMQGELGTSHAYVTGGDLKVSPRWSLGSLASFYRYDPRKKAYAFHHIGRGDPWSPDLSSPLLQPGVNVKEGDLLYAINNIPLSDTVTPGELLFNFSCQDIALDISDASGKNRRTVVVHTLGDDLRIRYRDWVEKNRAYVHQVTKGRVGYIHIPDMGAEGYAEFHRSFLQEQDREGLIVDVRFNGGGFVSQLLIEKLSRKRLGYDVTRWQGMVPYPEDSPMGPMVGLTNEYAGSDGDMFSHVFKVKKLGPLIGKRTWGGIIGISPRYGLVDGGYTTQPEYAFWFKDLGWSIENHGVEPDIEVDITPQDYAAGRDPQLDCAIEEIEKTLKDYVALLPDTKDRPRFAFKPQGS